MYVCKRVREPNTDGGREDACKFSIRSPPPPSSPPPPLPSPSFTTHAARVAPSRRRLRRRHSSFMRRRKEDGTERPSFLFDTSRPAAADAFEGFHISAREFIGQD